MPSNPPGYANEYYHKNKEKFNNAKEKKKRAARNRARRIMVKAGLAHKGDGKDVDHKKPLRSGGSNSKKNLRVISRAKNRADNGH